MNIFQASKINALLHYSAGFGYSQTRKFYGTQGFPYEVVPEDLSLVCESARRNAFLERSVQFMP